MTAYADGRRFGPLEGRLPISFEEKYSVDPESGCWLWTAAISNGYGKVWFRRRLDYAHRVAHLVLVGPIPAGMQIDHLCRVRRCVNPDHLELVTQKENILRSTSPSALHARKTHCPEGHLYAGDNLSISRGQRSCRTCRRRKQSSPEYLMARRERRRRCGS